VPARRGTRRAPPPGIVRGLGSPPPARFFRRPALVVAPELLGLVLWRGSPEGDVAGRIVEVEAYCGPDDLAAHSAGGRRTARTEVMYAAGGVAYVYFVYGIHHCVNVVASVEDRPQAVLLRAVEPIAGLELMRARRGARVPDAALARGPGNLACAFGIDRALNGADLRSSALRILVPRGARAETPVAPGDVVASPRIGVDYAGEWAARPWRFSVRGNASVSRPPRTASPDLSAPAPSARSAPRSRPPGRSAPR